MNAEVFTSVCCWCEALRMSVENESMGGLLGRVADATSAHSPGQYPDHHFPHISADAHAVAVRARTAPGPQTPPTPLTPA